MQHGSIRAICGDPSPAPLRTLHGTPLPRSELHVDRDTFDSMAMQHLDAMYRMAMQLARHPDDAGDLVQEAYLKALRFADRYEEQGGGMRPWLFKILHNVFYSKVTREKRGPMLAEEFPSAESAESSPGDPEPAWDLETLDWEHVDDRLKRAIDDLKPEYASILLLWGVEGLKYREIADVQGLPIGTVMSRLHRARAILAEELAELAEENRIAARSTKDPALGSTCESGGDSPPTTA